MTMTAGIVAMLVLSGCAGGSEESSPRGDDGGRPVVLTTFTVLADIARNVAGDHLTVESITKDGAEIHDYEPTPQDVAKASRADLILDNGLGLEAWFDQFVAASGAPRVDVSSGVETIDITGGARAGEPNPHAWMSPSGTVTYVDNMAAAFSDLDPENAEDYRQNASDYSEELREVQETLVAALADVPESQRVLVTCEGAFSYLARDAGLRELYLWPVNSEEEGTARQVAAVIDQVRADDVPAVFCESSVPLRAMQQVVDATGATFGGTLYVDSLSLSDGVVPSYLDLIRHDATTIADGLTGRTSS